MPHTFLTKVAALFLLLATACQAPTSVSPEADTDAGVDDREEDKAITWRRTFYITLPKRQTESTLFVVGCDDDWSGEANVARVRAIDAPEIAAERRATVNRITYFVGDGRRFGHVYVSGKRYVQTQRKFEASGTGTCVDFYVRDSAG